MSELKILLITGLLCFVLGIVTVSIECRNLGSLFLLASVLVFIGLYCLNEKYINCIPNAKDRNLVSYFFQQFKEVVQPILPELINQIHSKYIN